MGPRNPQPLPVSAWGMVHMLLGCIADDLTGATDLALTLKRGGMRTAQVIGAPTGAPPDADAVVVALKSRTIPAEAAVRLSLASAEALLAAGARQLFFKYCSTFDSTDKGNIGPVCEALMERLNAPITIACPAFPANGRTVYHGHLFVGRALLSESAMRDHPLTPMRDANLVRLLGAQTRQPVGLVPFESVEAGAGAVTRAFGEARREGTGILIVDALSEAHLRTIGLAAADLALITGGSGVALGLPENFRQRGLLAEKNEAGVDPFRLPEGRAAILSGSCSAATRGQVERARQAGMAAYRLDPLDLVENGQSVEAALRWASDQNSDKPILFTSTAEPEMVAEAQTRLGRERAAQLVEDAMAELAVWLVQNGFTHLSWQAVRRRALS